MVEGLKETLASTHSKVAANMDSQRLRQHRHGLRRPEPNAAWRVEPWNYWPLVAEREKESFRSESLLNVAHIFKTYLFSFPQGFSYMHFFTKNIINFNYFSIILDFILKANNE